MAERRGPEIPDGIELHKDGTVTVTVDNARCRLRRPKLGEFRKLRERLRERDDERLRLLAAQAADPLPAPEESAEGQEKLDYTLAVAARGRELNDAIAQLNIEWIREAMDMLARDTVLPEDDWPSGMDSSETVQALADHWRAVPLRSGGA